MAGSDVVEPTTGAAAGTGAGPVPSHAGDRQVLRTTDLRLRPGAEPISIGVAPGEILGLAGLEGQGQEDFARAISGLGGHVDGGIVVLDTSGAEHALRRRRDAKRYGVAYVPRDRKQDGLFFPLSILDNFGMAIYTDMNRLGILRGREIRSRFRDESARLHLSKQRSSQLVGSLSGGNQQKVLLAKWFQTRPRLILLDEPTQGVDVGARAQVFAAIAAAARDGAAVLCASADYEQLTAICDRVLVFDRGAVVAELVGDAIGKAAIAEACYRGE
jgi:ABC-type sugar transport system ATPase subunit